MTAQINSSPRLRQLLELQLVESPPVSLHVTRLLWESLRLSRWAHCTPDEGDGRGAGNRSRTDSRSTIFEFASRTGLWPQVVYDPGGSGRRFWATCVECAASAELRDLWCEQFSDTICKLRQLHKHLCSYSSIGISEDHFETEEGVPNEAILKYSKFSLIALCLRRILYECS